MKSIVQVVQNLLKPYIDSNIQTLNSALTTLTTKVSNSSDVYDPNKNGGYKVGELCLSPEDGTLQRCTGDISGAWSIAKNYFTQDTLANVSTLLTDRIYGLNDYTEIQATLGTGVTGSIKARISPIVTFVDVSIDTLPSLSSWQTLIVGTFDRVLSKFGVYGTPSISRTTTKYPITVTISSDANVRISNSSGDTIPQLSQVQVTLVCITPD